MLSLLKGVRTPLLILLAFLVSQTATAAAGKSNGRGDWLSGGQDNHNHRNQPKEKEISPDTAADLGVKWAFVTTGDVTATPAVDRDSVYIPDWGGMLYSIDRDSGVENWSVPVSAYNGLNPTFFGQPGGAISRTTPAIRANDLIIGDQGGREFAGTSVISVDKKTGEMNWITQVDNHPAALVTQSPVVHGNTVYVGVASNEEAFAAFVPGYPCCDFRGSMVALDANTGDILWKRYLSPDPSTGFSGNGVWGSTPVIDTKRNSVYVTTGNNYTAPQWVLNCVAGLGPNPAPVHVKACVDAAPGSEDNHFDSIVSLDMYTGDVNWATKALPYDAWTVQCIFPIFPQNSSNCPQPAGPDYDFGQGPMLFTVYAPREKGRGVDPIDIIGAGQKSGQFWALNPDNGDLFWVTQVGAGGVLGGLQWGSATDGVRIYSQVTPEGWSALDPVSGVILWSQPLANPPLALTFGPVSVANGVMFGGSTDPDPNHPTMFALDAATGAELWSFNSGASVGGGAAIVDGTVYWGSGYTVLGPPSSGNNLLYAFSLD